MLLLFYLLEVSREDALVESFKLLYYIYSYISIDNNCGDNPYNFLIRLEKFYNLVFNFLGDGYGSIKPEMSSFWRT